MAKVPDGEFSNWGGTLTIHDGRYSFKTRAEIMAQQNAERQEHAHSDGRWARVYAYAAGILAGAAVVSVPVNEFIVNTGEDISYAVPFGLGGASAVAFLLSIHKHSLQEAYSVAANPTEQIVVTALPSPAAEHLSDTV
jgi:hypothetical protein